MRIFDHKLRALAIAVALLTLGFAAPLAAQGSVRQPTFKSPEAAYEQGMGAWRSGFPEVAIPAFRFASDHDNFLAQFYLARILSDSGTAYTDHGGAYRLYQKIANEHANVDPDDDQRAAFVAKAFTALAAYVKDGLPVIGLRPEPARAAEYLRHAAQFFNHEDAQFELAKLYLKGEGVPQDPRTGLHWLSVLTQRGHAGAQAFLADIYWRGRYGVARDQLRAFALITVAVENAPDSERLWIEDIHQNIFCGASSGTRSQAQGMVADWRQKYGRSVVTTDRYGLGALPPTADRACGNGEPVTSPVTSVVREKTRSIEAKPPMQGGLLGVGATRPDIGRSEPGR